MKVLKFKIHADYYEQFKEICLEEEITVKRKYNVLLSQDRNTKHILDYFPEDHNEKARKMTLKVNEELYKGVMKKCGLFDLRVRDYMAYLIYKFLSDRN
ncbi:MAG: hypothetical protein JEZ08_09135 [Clostridiales bacterium]|nr:hypothetical protein [Clostridiales bacterium]